MTMIEYTETLKMRLINCADCGMPFGISYDFERRKREDHKIFYCPNGHSKPSKVRLKPKG